MILLAAVESTLLQILWDYMLNLSSWMLYILVDVIPVLLDASPVLVYASPVLRMLILVNVCLIW